MQLRCARSGDSSALSTGLQAYLKLNGNTTDSSSKGNSGSALGSGTYVTGVDGNAFNINDVASYITVPNIAVGTSFSYSGWYRLSFAASTQWQTFFHSNSYCGSGNTLGLMYERNAKFLRVYAGNVCEGVQTIPMTLATDKWVHVAVTYDGVKVRTYVDAVLKGEVASSIALGNGGPFVVGANHHPLTYNWQGAMDEVRIYSRALQAAEIAALADQANLLVPSAP
jgi:hypothetical protein